MQQQQIDELLAAHHHHVTRTTNNKQQQTNSRHPIWQCPPQRTGVLQGQHHHHGSTPWKHRIIEIHARISKHKNKRPSDSSISRQDHKDVLSRSILLITPFPRVGLYWCAAMPTQALPRISTDRRAACANIMSLVHSKLLSWIKIVDETSLPRIGLYWCAACEITGSVSSLSGS